MKFLEDPSHNLRAGDKGFAFSYIYWLMGNKQFYIQVTDILRKRMIYDQAIWAFSVTHSDERTLREYLARTNDSAILRHLDEFQHSKLVTKDGEESSRHFDYYPMVNSRAHALGGQADEDE